MHSETERDPIFLLGNRLDIKVFSIVGDEEESETKEYPVPKCKCSMVISLLLYITSTVQLIL